MAKLTKQDLAREVAAKAKIPVEQALDIIDITITGIADSLLRGDKVEIRNFGVLSAKLSGARQGRNLKKPSEIIHIPPQPVVKFRLGKRFRELLTRRFAREAKQ
jgi:integration host factor subunit beta